MTNDFNFETWLLRHSSWEDPDGVMNICSLDETGGFAITDSDWELVGSGKTLEAACKDYEKQLYTLKPMVKKIHDKKMIKIGKLDGDL